MNIMDFSVKARVWKAGEANDLAALLMRVAEWLRLTPSIAVQDIAILINDEQSVITVYYVEISW